MDAKQILTELFTEQKTLKEKVRKLEEAKMSKMRENEIGRDTQAEPSQPAPKNKGTSAVAKDATQDKMAKKYEENEISKDTQTEPSKVKNPSANVDAKKVGADTMSKKYQEDESEVKDETKKESDDADEDDKKKEAVGEDNELKKKEAAEDKDYQRFKKIKEAMEEDEEKEAFGQPEGNEQGKMVEILEALTKRIEALENPQSQDPMQKQAAPVPAMPPDEKTMAQEPKPPVVEKFSPGKMLFSESVEKTDSLKSAVRKILNNR